MTVLHQLVDDLRLMVDLLVDLRRTIFHWLALGVALGQGGFNCPRGGADPTQSPNASGFALQWNIGLCYIPVSEIKAHIPLKNGTQTRMKLTRKKVKCTWPTPEFCVGTQRNLYSTGLRLDFASGKNATFRFCVG